MSDRSSKWSFIVYPDSAPEGWKNILKYSFVKCAISPLHSPEQESCSGDLERKKHWHVMLEYDSLKSFEQVKGLSVLCNGTIPVILDNPSGYYQYLIHKNNPEKQQFEKGFSEIEEFNNFDGEKYQEYTKKQLDAIFKDIINIIEKYNISEYESLLLYFMDSEHDKEDYFRIARCNTIFFNTFLSSKRNKDKDIQLALLQKKISEMENKIK